MPKAHQDHGPAAHLGAGSEAAAKGLCMLQTEELTDAKGGIHSPGAPPPGGAVGLSLETPGV